MAPAHPHVTGVAVYPALFILWPIWFIFGGKLYKVGRFTSYPIFVIRPTQPAQPAYRPKSEKRA